MLLMVFDHFIFDIADIFGKAWCAAKDSAILDSIYDAATEFATSSFHENGAAHSRVDILHYMRDIVLLLPLQLKARHNSGYLRGNRDCRVYGNRRTYQIRNTSYVRGSDTALLAD